MRRIMLVALLFAMGACGKDSDTKKAPSAGPSDTAANPSEPVPPATPAAAKPAQPTTPAATKADDSGNFSSLLMMIAESAGTIEAGKPGGDCGAVADHLSRFAAAVVATMGKAGGQTKTDIKTAKATAAAQIRPMVEQMCRYQSWSPKMRDCTLAATNKDALSKCGELISKEAPADTGKASCDAVAKHMIEIMTKGAKVPAAQQPMMDKMASGNAKRCVEDNWSLAGRRCMMDAVDGKALRNCMMMIMK